MKMLLVDWLTTVEKTGLAVAAYSYEWEEGKKLCPPPEKWMDIVN